MKQLIGIWLLLVTGTVFGQEADLSIELEVRPSLTLVSDQTGFLDVIITNLGPAESAGSFFLSPQGTNELPPIRFVRPFSGPCGIPPFLEPPPPGYPYFTEQVTILMAANERVTCTYPFQLESTIAQSVDIRLEAKPRYDQPNDPNLSNNIDSVTVIFSDIRPVPLLNSIALLILSGLLLLVGAIKGRDLLKRV